MMKPSPKTLRDYISLLLYLMKQIHLISKSFLPLSIIITILNAITPFIFVILPSLLIDELTNSKQVTHIILYTVGIVGGGCIASLLASWLSKRRNIHAVKINKLFDLNVGLAIAETDYQHLENPEYLNTYQKYKNASNHSSQITYVFSNIFDIVSSSLVLLGYIIIMINLMLTDKVAVSNEIKIIDFIASNTYIWMLFLIAASIISVRLQTHSNNCFQKYQNDFAPTQRAYIYYQNLSGDYKNAKDIRLFNFYELLSKRINAYLNDMHTLLRKLSESKLKYTAPANILLKLQIVFIYGLVSIKVLVQAISYGQFYLYFMVISNVFTTISNILSEIASVKYACGYHYAYEVIIELSKNSQGNADVHFDNINSIDFVNVSFQYPNTELWVLKDFSCTINCGQRVSIVGLNGAGKTTLIKLLQRLYVPNEGMIMINGIDIQTFKFDKYMKLFSTVFQDIHDWAYSVGENVSCSREYDCDVIQKYITDVGIWQLFENRNGLETPLTRYFSQDGIVLSGGERQKLLIARALYKNAPIFIFDEPTAALDPLAEMEIMEQVNYLTHRKTTLFISHRLASCRFSDQILVIHEGQLFEYGTHDELIKNHNKYYELWNSQSQYYQDTALVK